MAPRRGAFTAALARDGVATTVLPYGWWLGKRAESALMRVLRYGLLAASILSAAWLAVRFRGRFDLVYTNTLATPVGALLARLLGTPHAWHVREFVDADHDMVFLIGRRRSLRLVDGWARLCIFNSEAVARTFRPALPSCEGATVYQAVTIDPRPPEPHAPGAGDAPLVALILGRLHPNKGQATAIAAVAAAKDRGVHVELAVVGGGKPEEAARLRRMADELGVADRATFHGFTDDPLPHMASCDVVLMCSLQEAFGRVTVEAMKLGRPVIGASSGGTVELIQPGRTGWLFRPGDADDLADRLIAAHEARDRLASMGEDARRWADATFSAGGYGDRIHELIVNVARRSPAARLQEDLA